MAKSRQRKFKKCTDVKCTKRSSEFFNNCSVLSEVPDGKCWARSEDPNWETKVEKAVQEYKEYKYYYRPSLTA